MKGLKYINFTFNEIAKAEDSDPDYALFEGIASTDVEDREGDIILSSAFSRTIQEKNRVPMLYWHSWEKSDMLGYFDSFEITNGGLKVVGHLYTGDENGKKTYSLIKKGIINQMSVGGKVITRVVQDKKNVITEISLMEISVVPQGKSINPEAMITAIKADIVDIFNENTENKDFEEYVRAYKEKSFFAKINEILGGN